jgi:cysteine desulfurase/selenocysteine lyase
MTGPIGRAEAFTDAELDELRARFPILSRRIGEAPLVYLDNAATTQKPREVIGAIVGYYERSNANVHRGVHRLSQEATEGYEAARRSVAGFLGAASAEEIIFTRGTTESINLVAQAWAGPRLKAGDEVLITYLEHHSNIVPWQMVCQQTGATLRVLPVADDATLELGALDELLSERTRVVAVSHVSNAVGTVNPVREIAARARVVGAVVVVDGAQATAHARIDVGAIGADFYAISGHKMFAPTGIGALWGRRELLEEMGPWQGGGEMIKSVSFERTIYNDVPHKFEAGTPNIAGAIGLGAAVAFIESVGIERIGAHERRLLESATETIGSCPGVRLIGTAPEKAAIVSFVVEGIHPHDLGTLLDQRGVAIRTGHHCAEPLMRRFGVPATARASFALYNTLDEVRVLGEALGGAIEVFS